MSKVELVLQILYYVIAFLVAAIPAIIVIIRQCKKLKSATTLAEQEIAINDLTQKLNEFVQLTEEAYNGVNSALKSQGQTAGALKKESVMAKLQAYAINKGYEFDVEYWSKAVDDIVSMTKNVNVK